MDESLLSLIIIIPSLFIFTLLPIFFMLHILIAASHVFLSLLRFFYVVLISPSIQLYILPSVQIFQDMLA
jgi:hypothetical protein